jgi:hypothetical protein
MSFYPCRVGGERATEQFAELIRTVKNSQEVMQLLGTPQGDVFDILNYHFEWNANPGTATVKFDLKKQSYIEFFADSENRSIYQVYLDGSIFNEGSMVKSHTRREIDNLEPGEHTFKLQLSYNTPSFFILRAVPK